MFVYVACLFTITKSDVAEVHVGLSGDCGGGKPVLCATLKEIGIAK